MSASLPEKKLRSIGNRFYILVVVGTIVVSIGAFTDAIGKIKRFVGETFSSQKTEYPIKFEQEFSIPKSPGYDQQANHEIRIVAPFGMRFLRDSLDYRLSYPSWGDWVAAPVWSNDDREVTRVFNHGKHDLGRQIKVSAQYVPKDYPNK